MPTGCTARAACDSIAAGPEDADENPTAGCPTGQKLIGAAATTLCAGAACASSDVDTCCEANTCNPLSTAPTGYTVATPSGTTVAGLGALACDAANNYVFDPTVTIDACVAPRYGITPADALTGANLCSSWGLCCGADYGETCCNDIYYPAVYWSAAAVSTACDTDGGDFADLTGCAPAGTCADATCPTGYKADASAASTVCASTVCDMSAGSAELDTCCDENVCTEGAAPEGYTAATASGTTVSGLGDVACAATHSGTAVATCATDAGDFAYTGCAEKAACSTISSSCPTGRKQSTATDAALCAGAAAVAEGECNFLGCVRTAAVANEKRQRCSCGSLRRR